MNVAVILTRNRYRSDVRNMGSGNAGATNVARVFGMGAGLATFAGDGIKTAAAMLLGRLIAGDIGFAVAGAVCLIGHIWPVFFSFRGGKGVTVSAVIGLLIDWRVCVIGVAVFLLVALLSKRVSAGSILGAASYPVTMFAIGGFTVYEISLGILVAAAVLFMHRGNIARLIKGTEPEFKPHKN